MKGENEMVSIALEDIASKLNNKEFQLKCNDITPTPPESTDGDETPTNELEETFLETLADPVEEEGGERVAWEFHNVLLSRVPGYGFGIAISGGRDNPHFANGDPSIAISDVLRAGPAKGKLLVNDRVLSANCISLENVDYSTAVQVLRECGNTVNLAIRRRIVLPPNPGEPHTMKVTLTKNRKKEDFGIVLGCRIYVKEITNKTGIEKDCNLQEGDVIMKINNSGTDNMSIKEARKLIENTKEKLHLLVRREQCSSEVEENQRWSRVHSFEPGSNPNKEMTPSNLNDVTGNRPQCSNQNLYVQPPTRGDFRPPPPPDRADGKNNLTRSQGGRDRGPLMDISLSQLDQPATPLLTGHGHSRGPILGDEDEPPPRPPPLRGEDNVPRRDHDPLSPRGKIPVPEPRHISFQKDGSVGIRLTGGNEVGIFVTAVQPGSPASLQGLQPGDKILKVNNLDMDGVTREEAVLFLLGIQDQVDLIVQHRKEEYDEIVANQKGDSFYVKTHFNHNNSEKGELNFHVGEVFHVIDTLYNGVVGSWLVYRLGRNNQEIQKGVIPNRNRGEELAQEQQNQAKKDAASESRGSFFKRRSARRTKSLSKDQWEDVILADTMSKFPAYERVTLKHPGFVRPVVFFGPLADVAREKLLKDYPDKYGSPQLDGHVDDMSKSQKTSGIIRLSAIKEIIEKGKHTILSITPNAVDRLNYAQFYPIVIFMRAESKHTVKELRSRVSKSNNKSSKKLYDHSVKLEKLWSHVFTATITLTGADMWYKKLRETIERQQQQAIWVSETKPNEAISDDFLFPLTSRLSYASSPESDLELASDSRPTSMHGAGSSLAVDPRMVKASSDPSIVTQEENCSPPMYGQPPTYSLSQTRQDLREPSQPSSQEMHQARSSSNKRSSEVGDKDGFFGSPVRSTIDPYATLTSGERYNSRDTTDNYLSRTRPSLEPEPPPNVDRSSKPTRFRTAQERLFASPGRGEIREPLQPGVTPDYMNTGAQKSNSLDRSNGRLETARPRDRFSSTSSQNIRSSHDPYRFTRSTAQPTRVNGFDRGRIPGTPSRYGPQGERPPPPPSPPPKPAGYQPRLADGRPIPPPKPIHFQARPWMYDDGTLDNRIPHDIQPPPPSRLSEAPPPYSQKRSSRDESEFGMPPGYYPSRTYPGADLPSPSRHPPPPASEEPRRLSDSYRGHPGRRLYQDDDNGGFDSGHGSNIDHSHDMRYTKVMGGNSLSPPRHGALVNGGGPYHNIPYGSASHPRSHQPPYSMLQHSSPPLPPPSVLDLSNRENRGSAFELYKKPDIRSMSGMPHPLPIGSDIAK
ncbi:tight junction protein ZO-3-like isoform X3 [Tachypleus tridentatus]|uniref:tight junction protein ZO-3-like isoform X3 n=1 Tax=Tachypleus tridentatus TaxID=6853 RepID=UPI003FCF5EDB